MGVTRETFIHYHKLQSDGHLVFNKKLKIIELGAQTVHFEDPNFLTIILSALGLDPAVIQNFKYDMASRFMHESFGYTYDCIDLDQLDPLAIPWDLNTAMCPIEMRQSYNLVTNHGTTEHLIGQANAFRVMHDLTSQGGIMLNILPCIEPNHGFFSYSPAFFESLAVANQYEVCGRYISETMNRHALRDLHTYTGQITFAPCYLHYALKKVNNNDFVLPTQIFNNGVKQ